MPFLLAEALRTRGERGDVFPVHRLDRGVGGLMVFARDSVTAGKLSALIAAREMTKQYLCLVHGAPAEAEGEYRDLLFKDSGRNKTFVVKRMRRGVKEAVLTYRLLAEREGLGLFSVRLYTGRTHQIRAQFAARRMPLYGDGKYGSVLKGAIALFAHRVSFPAPNGGGGIEGVATPPTETAPWGLFSDLL